ncbi:unnamed protein product, partial [Discosporangium mesarthrocarpum]
MIVRSDLPHLFSCFDVRSHMSRMCLAMVLVGPTLQASGLISSMWVQCGRQPGIVEYPLAARVRVRDGYVNSHERQGCMTWRGWGLRESLCCSRISATRRRATKAGTDPRGSGDRRVVAGNSRGIDKTDHYSALGVSKTATVDEIKAAYRKIARETHPDVSDDAATREVFEAAAKAYRVLLDPGKRSTYDQGIAMSSFVDSIKSGAFDWRAATGLVAGNLGAMASSVGAAAQPLAKDLAETVGRSVVTATVQGLEGIMKELNEKTVTQQAAQRKKFEAERKVALVRRKASETRSEAEVQDALALASIQGQGEWNVTLSKAEKDASASAAQLSEAQATTANAEAELRRRQERESEASRGYRQAKAEKATFDQESTNAARALYMAETMVKEAEKRMDEAIKALQQTKESLVTTSQEAEAIRAREGQVLGAEAEAAARLESSRLSSAEGRLRLKNARGAEGMAAAEARSKEKLRSMASLKAREMGSAAEAAKTRAEQLRSQALAHESTAREEVEKLEKAEAEEKQVREEVEAAERAALAMATATAQPAEASTAVMGGAGADEGAHIRRQAAVEAAAAAAAAVEAAAGRGQGEEGKYAAFASQSNKG